MQELTTFTLIERISNLLRSEERKKLAAIGLQPVHIHVLEYLASCNRFSDTPASVADYLGLTKGTVSQSLQVLERKGYLTKNQDPDDGRVVHLSLSPEGRALLEECKPKAVLAATEQVLARQPFTNIETALTLLLSELQKANQTKSFGVCRSCVNFLIENDHYLCNLTQLPLSHDDSQKICREHIYPVKDQNGQA